MKYHKCYCVTVFFFFKVHGMATFSVYCTKIDYQIPMSRTLFRLFCEICHENLQNFLLNGVYYAFYMVRFDLIYAL